METPNRVPTNLSLLSEDSFEAAYERQLARDFDDAFPMPFVPEPEPRDYDEGDTCFPVDPSEDIPF